jgi:hypothetical protein
VDGIRPAPVELLRALFLVGIAAVAILVVLPALVRLAEGALP